MIDPAEIAVVRRALGKRLAAYRRAAGLNQVRFAPLTGYGRSTVANVETGRQRAPRDFWVRCDDALATGGALATEFDALAALEKRLHREQAEAAQARRAGLARQELAGLASVGGARRSSLSSAAPWVGNSDDLRREAWFLWNRDLSPSMIDGDDQLSAVALRWVVAPDDVPTTTRKSGWRRIGRGDADRIRAVRQRLKAIDNAHGGGTAFPMTAAFLRHEVAPLLDGAYDDATGRLVVSATAELALDAGWMAYDAGDHQLARRYMVQALHMAHASGDRLFGGRVLAAMSHQALHLSQVQLAIDLACAARAGTRHVATPAVTAMLTAMEACAYAASNNRGQCLTALAESESALARARSGDDNPGWLDFDEGGLWGHAARAFRDLGSPTEAERYARQAVLQCHSDHDRTRVQRNAILAAACIERGDAEQAAALGEAIVRDAWYVQSRHVHQEVASLATRLGRTHTAAASDFLSQAHQLLAASQRPPAIR